MLNSVWKSKIFVIIIIILAFFIPQFISRPAQTEVRSVVIGMGIDKFEKTDNTNNITGSESSNITLNSEENLVELSAQIIVPHYNTGFNENAQVISAVGENVADAFERMSLHIGKILGLSHCSVIVIGGGMKNEDVMQSLDWFYRSKRLDSNADLLFTNGSAKEILKTSLKADNNLSLSLNNILQFNDPIDLTESQKFIEFVQTYYNNYGASFLSVVDLVDEDYLGLSIQDAGSSGGGSSDSSGGVPSGGKLPAGEENKYLSNNGDTAIFKKGKLVAILNSNEMRGFNSLNNSAQRGLVVLNNVTDDVLTNADVSLTKRGEISTYTLSFKNGKPVILYNLKYKVRVEQILQDNKSVEILQGYNDYITSGVQKAFKDFVLESSANAVNISKKLNVDCLGIYDKFSKFKPKQWQEYLNSLENPEDYIQGVQFYVNVYANGND